MSHSSSFFSFFSSTLSRLFCVVCAIGAMQLPLYIQQYRIALQGAVTESQKLYADLERQAAQVEMTLPEYIQVHQSSSQEVFQNTGKALNRFLSRHQSYLTALHALEVSSPWALPFVCLQHFDLTLHQSLSFSPAVPLDFTALSYGLIGLFFASALCALVQGTGRGRRLPS